MPTQTTKPQVVINKMTKVQFDNITPNDGELYFITDDVINASEINGLATVATSGSYNDLLDKPEEKNDIFWVTYNVTIANEIYSAIYNNKIPLMRVDDIIYYYNGSYSTGRISYFSFCAFYNDTYNYYECSTIGGWTERQSKSICNGFKLDLSSPGDNALAKAITAGKLIYATELTAPTTSTNSIKIYFGNIQVTDGSGTIQDGSKLTCIDSDTIYIKTRTNGAWVDSQIKIDFSNYYTKAEIDSMIGSVYHIKGSDTCSNISAITDQQSGDVWDVTDTGTISGTWGSISVSAGDNIVWNGTRWDKLAASVDLSLYYTKTEVDNLLDDKADSSTTLAGYGITNAYTKTETDDLLDSKADSSTTLAGYGITNAYTKTETDDLLDSKADSSTTLAGYGITNAYTKTEVDNALNEKQDVLVGQGNDFGTINIENDIVSISDAPVKRVNGVDGSVTIGSNHGTHNVTGVLSMTLGDNNTLAGAYNTAIGSTNKLNATADTAIGYNNTVNGEYSTTFGISNIVGNPYSLAAGVGLLNGEADGTNNTAWQTTLGRYNKPSGSFTRITGNGSSDDNRSNCETLSPDGELWTATDVMCGGTDQWSPVHKLSDKISDTPDDGVTYNRTHGEWKPIQKIIPVGTYMGTVPTKDDLPSAPFLEYVDSNNTEVKFKYFINYVDDTHINGLTITVEPVGTTQDAWFRNNENWHRASIGGVADTNISFDGVTLNDVGYSVDLTTFGPGKNKANISFNDSLNVSKSTNMRIICRTWGAVDATGVTRNNEYTLTDITLSFASLTPILTGSIYTAVDTGLSYIYSNGSWEEYEVVANHNYLNPAQQLVGGVGPFADMSIRDSINSVYNNAVGADFEVYEGVIPPYTASSNIHNYIFIPNGAVATAGLRFPIDIAFGKYTVYCPISYITGAAVYTNALYVSSTDAVSMPLTTIAGATTSTASTDGRSSVITTVFIVPANTTSGRRMLVHYMRY